MHKNQKILVGLTFLTMICMILVIITLQQSFQSKSTQEISAKQAEQVEARELANMAIWAQGAEVLKNQRLDIFKKINQWRIKHQYARRELLIFELQLAKIEQVEQSIYDRLAYELTSVSYRQVTQQNNRQLLLLLIEYYIRSEQFQAALDLLKKYQLTGTGLEETLRYQVCTRLQDGICTTSPAK